MGRILVAEDDQFTRDMVQRALEGDGHDVSAFDDGGDALDASRGGPPFDLVITDIGLPNVNGIALTEALLQDNADQRVIIMSALTDELSRAQNLSGPNVKLLNKPFTLEQIRQEAARLLK